MRNVANEIRNVANQIRNIANWISNFAKRMRNVANKIRNIANQGSNFICRKTSMPSRHEGSKEQRSTKKIHLCLGDFYGSCKRWLIMFFIHAIIFYAHENTTYQLITHSIDDRIVCFSFCLFSLVIGF
jgi:hypothetical protein